MRKRRISINGGSEEPLHPHPVAFADEYLFWLFLFTVPFMIHHLSESLMTVVAGWTLFHSLLAKAGLDESWRVVLYCGLYTGVFLTAGLLFSVRKINTAWARLMLLLCIYVIAAGFIFSPFTKVRLALVWGTGILSLLGFLLVEKKRRDISYRVEEDGIVIARNSLFSNERMFYRFPHISHVYLKTTVAEKLFGCGTIIIIPSSGMNIGYDTIGSGLFHFFIGAERTRTLPRSIPVYSMFSIKRADAVLMRLRESIRYA